LAATPSSPFPLRSVLAKSRIVSCAESSVGLLHDWKWPSTPSKNSFSASHCVLQDAK
jgi:hypothetical protein